MKQSQTWNDIVVSARECAGIVTVTVERWNQSGSATIFATPSVAGHIKAGHRPSRSYRQMLGVKGDGSWLYMEVDAAGAVKVGSLYAPGDSSTWGSFSGTLSYPVGQLSVSRIVTGTVTKSIKQPGGTDWAYITSLLSYDEVEDILGRPFDVSRDQFFATNVRWEACQVLVVPFVQKMPRGGVLNAAVITPTGQGGGGQTKSLTIGWTIIKGEQLSVSRKSDLVTRADVDAHTISFGWESDNLLTFWIDDTWVASIPSGFTGQLSVSRFVCGITTISFQQGQYRADALIDVGFEPVGAVATMQGGNHAYVDVSAQLDSANSTCIMLCAYRDTTITSGAEERKCAYIVFGQRLSVSHATYISTGRSGGSGSLGEIVCRPVPPSWARGRKPDSVLYALAENNNEGLSKLFFVTLWSVDAPDQFQLRLWRKDNDQYASNQGVFAYWAAMWTRQHSVSQDITAGVMVTRVGSVAVVSADYIASNTAGSSIKVGTLPDGMAAVPGLGSDGGVHIAPLGYRGNADGRTGYLAVYSGTGNIFIWTSTAGASERYYFGQVVVPLEAW